MRNLLEYLKDLSAEAGIKSNSINTKLAKFLISTLSDEEQMLEYKELLGYYTYRSFIDNQLPVNDFNNIKSEEAELFLILHSDGAITGTLSFPAAPTSIEKLFMDITGNVKNWSSPIILEFKAQGRSNTVIFDHLYKFSCSVTHMWEKGISQRLCLTGTVLRSQDHDNTGNEQIAEANVTKSFVAVKRDFPEPRDIDGVKIIPNALSMLASKSHRLKHAVWHTLRRRGIWYILDEESKSKIRQLGWGLDRPPFDERNQLNLSNGAGEDFLFMHRKMIAMIKDEYKSQGVPYIKGWKSIPAPFEGEEFPKQDEIYIDTHQFFYSEQEDPQHPGKKIYRLNIPESGNMVPPPYFVPSESKEDDSRFLRYIKFLKSPEYFRNVMDRFEKLFKNNTFLATISLGALGNLLEFEIHNQMHMRWSNISVDPESGKPSERDPFDTDSKWDNPKYDYLGDFYSSHVHPLFWRLHGWVDDRIEDWYNAHEAVHPGEIERFEFEGVKWFKPGKWVMVSNPFYWPEHNHNHHHHNANDRDEIDAMLKVLEIVRRTLRPETARALSISPRKSDLMSFMGDIKPEK